MILCVSMVCIHVCDYVYTCVCLHMYELYVCMSDCMCLYSVCASLCLCVSGCVYILYVSDCAYERGGKN